MGFGWFRGFRPSFVSLAVAAALLCTAPVLDLAPAQADNDKSFFQLFKKKRSNSAAQEDGAPANTNWSSHADGKGGPATTKTEIVNDGSVAPFLTAGSSAALQAAEIRFEQIVASGGWGRVPGGKFKKGVQNKAVVALNRRLFVEGYLREEATQGQYADVYTTATEDAVTRFQRNHGLAVTGMVDNATLRELNVSADRRLATIRANLPRVAEYSRDLGPRYVVVNVPAQQIEAISYGAVYSIHNAIVGRPSRPTPVVMTNIATIKFSPYWNAPASIVERDILPRMRSGGAKRVMREMNMKVFHGVGGPEVNPDRINWRRAVVDDFHFRQEPGGTNAMASAKIEFDSPFGIYLHDTPEQHLFGTGQRFYSSGCVRVEKVAVLLNWILQGQSGLNQSRIADLADSKERLDHPVADPPQIRVTYLTAWPGRNGEVHFRPDIYELDGSGFVMGQPLPVGETSDGLRYVLKPIPRDVEADEAFGFFNFGFGRSRNYDRTDTVTNRTLFFDDSLGGDSKKLKKVKAATASASNWLTEKTNELKKKPLKKSPSTAKKSKDKTKVATKKPAKKAAESDSTKKAETKTVQTAAAVSCKPDANGKLPANCPPEPTPKPKAKPVSTATPAAN